MDAARVNLLRQILDGTEWIDRTQSFARSMRRSTTTPGGLLLVGTPAEEPWHFAAHLDDESRYSGIPELSPTLVRWAPPPGAPAHLAVGLERLEAARRGESLLVVAPDVAPSSLLERVDDARRIGATIFAIDGGDTELQSLAHDSLVVPSSGLIVPRGTDATDGANGLVTPWSDDLLGLDTPEMSFDTVEHLISLAAGESVIDAPSRRRGLRDRLARVIDTVSGPSSRDY